MSYTKGPWVIDEADPQHLRIRAADSKPLDMTVALVPKANAADAGLIAAAPELVDMLSEMWILCGTLGNLNSQQHVVWERAKDLIYRATEGRGNIR